ncbi:hypothetical protein [Spirosoma jeollabukense]
MVAEVTTLTPTLTLPNKADEETVQAFKLWASVPANDEIGITIDNVQVGDQVYVYDGAGIASFDKVNMAAVKGIVGIANAIAGGALVVAQPETAPFVAAWDTGISAILAALPDELGNKRRDMYGCDPGTGDYAKDEGGLIVCMPESHGPIYATDNYTLTGDTKNDGRLYKYYSDDTKKVNAFFPCPVINNATDPGSGDNGRLLGTATKDGAVHILAFDKDYNDNAGYYNVGLIIIRSNAVPDAPVMIQLLEESAPTGGI